ncbi:MAG: hypothetical protein LUD72_02310, partial [Bacteroidales bacterium]|nr:hypothetical protein [Bacteroidales bacterium]
ERFLQAEHDEEDSDISEEEMMVEGAAERAERNKRKLLDAVRTIYEKGRDVAAKLYSHTHFTVAYTPEFMKKLGLRGYRFTISYSVIVRHAGRDKDHDIPIEAWERLPEMLQTPFAITKYYNPKKKEENKKKDKGDEEDEFEGYNVYIAIQIDNAYIVVGIKVKNIGRNLEANSISTVFRRKRMGKLEDVIYRDKNITPKQTEFLKSPIVVAHSEMAKDKDGK